MKKLFPLFFSLLLSLSLVAQEQLSNKALIPLPRYMVDGSGQFVFNRHTKIMVEDDRFIRPAVFLQEMFVNSGAFVLDMKISNKSPKNSVVFRNAQIDSLGQEGYILEITPENIIIIANTGAGAYYAVQTLRQLLPWQIEETNPAQKTYAVPCGTIVDFPEYSYRSMMIDVDDRRVAPFFSARRHQKTY